MLPGTTTISHQPVTRSPLNVNRPVLLYIGPEGTVVHDRDILINFPAEQRPMPFASV